jgi:integrase
MAQREHIITRIMSVFKRYQGKRITSKHPKYKTANWWMYKRIRGQKTIHKSLPDCQNREDAEKAERKEIEKSFNKRYGIQDTTTTCAEFADSIYTKYVGQHNVNIPAKNQYIRILNHHFGKRLLSDISPQDCRDCQHTLSLGNLSPSSVNRIMSTLSKIFTLACEEGLLERNPMQFVRSLKEPAPRKRLLTDEQKAKLFVEIEKDEFLRNIVTLAVNLPLRKGQLLAITKESVDFERRTLLTISSKGREPRLVPLNERALSVLRELAEKTPKGILLRIDGQPIKDFRKRWRTALVAAGINEKDGSRGDNFHFHDLRVEFASSLIRRNVNPTVVQNLFAHSGLDITNIYIETDLEMMRLAVKSLDDSISESEGVN